MIADNIKQHVKRSPRLKRLALLAQRVLAAPGWSLRPSAITRYAAFIRDWHRFRRAGGTAATLDLYPCLHDKTSHTGIDSHYFHQAIWAFRRIKESGAHRHVDIGSQIQYVGLLTAITEVVFVDIRPLFLHIPGYLGVGASISSLPFRDASFDSLSCLHVIEHIGLGRYGDPIDPLGPEKACREITRVLGPGGHAYISVPIGRPHVSFNGQRVFGVEEALKLFPGLRLEEMAMVDVAGNFIASTSPESADIRESAGGLDFGLGLFRFRKAPNG